MTTKLANLTDEQLINAMPHGSGIDASWRVERLKNGKVVLHNSYHGMHESGMYDGWQDFKVTLFEDDNDIEFKLAFTGQRMRRSWVYGLKEYLEDTIVIAIESDLKPMLDYEQVA